MKIKKILDYSSGIFWIMVLFITSRKATDTISEIISAMGMGNKLDPTQIEVSDISKTSVCPLAKTIRKQLRAKGINHLKVVYSRELPNRFDKSEEHRRTTASISFVPSVGGLIIASQIVRDLIDEF